MLFCLLIRVYLRVFKTMECLHFCDVIKILNNVKHGFESIQCLLERLNHHYETHLLFQLRKESYEFCALCTFCIYFHIHCFINFYFRIILYIIYSTMFFKIPSFLSVYLFITNSNTLSTQFTNCEMTV